MLAIGMKACSFTAKAAGMVFNRISKFVFLGGKIGEDGSIENEIDHRVQQACGCSRCNSQAMYGRRSAPLELKVRYLPAEVVGTPLHGCVTWNLTPMHYSKLRKAHNIFILCCIGWKKWERVDRLMCYAEVLIKVGCGDSSEATVHKRRQWFAEIVARIGDNRLHKIALLGKFEMGAR